MKITTKQIEEREDSLAKEEYGRDFVELPADVRQSIHNAALEEFGIRRKFTFICLDCGTVFEDFVEGELVEIYTEIQSDTHSHVLESCCPKCKQKKEREAEQEEPAWT